MLFAVSPSDQRVLDVVVAFDPIDTHLCYGRQVLSTAHYVCRKASLKPTSVVPCDDVSFLLSILGSLV